MNRPDPAEWRKGRQRSQEGQVDLWVPRNVLYIMELVDQVFRVVYGMNDFVLNQYKYRLKIMKVHEELLSLFRPKIQMSEINFVIEE